MLRPLSSLFVGALIGITSIGAPFPMIPWLGGQGYLSRLLFAIPCRY